MEPGNKTDPDNIEARLSRIEQDIQSLIRNSEHQGKGLDKLITIIQDQSATLGSLVNSTGTMSELVSGFADDIKQLQASDSEDED